MRVIVALLLSCAVAGAQDPGAAAAQSDSLYFAGKPGDALAYSEAVLSANDDAGIRWRAARAAIAQGMMLPDNAERRALYDTALSHARRGYALAPQSLEARYWVAAAAGRRAHKNDPIYSAKLAMEVYEQSTALLAVDSMHAGAHHALGRLHTEVLRVPRLVRFVAARVLRVDLAGRANRADAERHSLRAVELEPGTIQFLVDLVDLYARAEKKPETKAALERLAAAPLKHPLDAALRDACLAKWQRKGAG